MNEVKKCPKCGSTEVMKRNVRLPDPTFAALGSLIATAYVCNSCGYIELYRK
jgi:predicted nucleic-acid-binding Zn-ribbon protein